MIAVFVIIFLMSACWVMYYLSGSIIANAGKCVESTKDYLECVSENREQEQEYIKSLENLADTYKTAMLYYEKQTKELRSRLGE